MIGKNLYNFNSAPFKSTTEVTPMKEGGATPINVPNQNGLNCTSITGDTMLINQLGRNGVIRRKII